jgi:hypothetical protein
MSISAVVACGGGDDLEKDEDRQADIGPFLGQSDLSAPKSSEAVVISGDQLHLNMAADHHLRASPLLDEGGAFELRSAAIGPQECYEKIAEQLSIKAQGSKATISGEVDFSECLRGQDKSLKSVMGKVQVFFEVTCKGADLAALNGKKLSQIASAQSPCETATEASTSFNLRVDKLVTGEASVNGKMAQFEQGSRRVVAGMGLDGKACKYRFVGGKMLKDGCIEIVKQVQTRSRTKIDQQVIKHDDEGMVSFRKYEFQNVEAVAESPLYVGGKVRVTMDGWKGDVIYQGEDKPPAWILNQDELTETGLLE